MVKVLVTGATGFIGAHLTPALASRGYEVRALVRRGAPSGHPLARPAGPGACRPELVNGDVIDEKTLTAAVAGCQIVFHLAGAVRAFSRGQFLKVNEQGVRNVAQACAAQRSPPTLVVVSSLAAAGPTSADRPRSEADPPRPVSHYGQSKRAGEVAAESFAGQTPITIVRPPMVFGEHDWSTYEIFRPIAASGIHFMPGFRARRFSLIHAADLAELLISAAERGTRLPPTDGSGPNGAAGYYFASDDERPTYAELGRMIGRAVGRRRVAVVPIPGPLAWTAAVGNEIVARLWRRPPVFNLDKVREAMAGSWTCSADRARRELGFSPRASLAERLAQTAEWYARQTRR